jgi:hypothetical protein
MTCADFEEYPIALRAYAEPVTAKQRRRPGNLARRTPASEWTLIFDTETETVAGQGLRFGVYQWRRGETLEESGIFYAPELPASELAVLEAYAHANGSKLITRDEFADRVFYGLAYDLRATIVGFNLPFDISRIAIGHGPARTAMSGGFSFKLSDDKRRPHVQVKHLSQKASLIQFAAPFRRRDAGSDRASKRYYPVRRGFFVDVATLARALFARSFKLSALSEFLKVETVKAESDGHGLALTNDYVGYAAGDVQTTWECYEKLVGRYRALQLEHASATDLQRSESRQSLPAGHGRQALASGTARDIRRAARHHAKHVLRRPL